MYFNNKNVCIVGSAGYLENLSLGDEIDRFDIVVRINKICSIMSDENAAWLGKRCDYLYHMLLEDPKNSPGTKFGYLTIDLWKDMGIKGITCLPSSDMKGRALGNFLSNLVKKESVKKIIDNNIPLNIVDYNFYNQISEATQCKPNTGIVGIFDILRQSPESLKIFGFSFLLDGWVSNYTKGVNMPGEKRTMHEIEVSALNSKRHVQKNQWLFCKNNLLNNEKVSFDPVLEEIMNMNSFPSSKEEFKHILENINTKKVIR